jgi:N-acyl-D-amino-acid deacylase
VLDIILKKGRVIDGSGDPWFRADVGIMGGRIEVVGNLSDQEAGRILDVGGLVITPGFMDPHSHSDWSILKSNEALSSLQQGITTEFVGNCGASTFPVTDGNRRSLLARMADSFRTDLDKVTVDWEDFASFQRRLEDTGIGANLACFVGHNTLRSAVMDGAEERGEPTVDELEEMKRLVARSMEQGAWGLTTGLTKRFGGGRNTKTDEVISLAGVAAGYGGSYMSHARSYRSLSGPEEFLRIAEETPIRSVLSHNGARTYVQQKRLAGPLPEEQLILFDRARKRGAEIYMDILPWSGYSSTSLLSLLIRPEDKYDEQGRRLTLDEFLAKLRNPEQRQEIVDRARSQQGFRNVPTPKQTESNTPPQEGSKPAGAQFGDAYIVNRSIRFPEYIGRSLAEIAEMRGTDVIGVAADLLLEDEGNTFWGSWQCEGDIKRLLQHPAAMVATDGYAVDRDEPLVHLGNAPAVRLYGSFPKVLGIYVREERLFPLEEAVRKMTSLPAKAIGIEDRGFIRPGAWADVCVFDPDRIGHMATYAEPRQYCVGIEYVLVNGELAMDGGVLTRSLAGKVLSHRGVPGWRSGDPTQKGEMTES